jgi:hypothetical protein
MKMHVTEPLDAIVVALKQHIAVAQTCGLDDTARLLAMAKLDLQMRIHDIAEEELRTFCSAIEDGNARKRGAGSRPVRHNEVGAPRRPHAVATTVRDRGHDEGGLIGAARGGSAGVPRRGQDGTRHRPRKHAR